MTTQAAADRFDLVPRPVRICDRLGEVADSAALARRAASANSLGCGRFTRQPRLQDR